MGKEREERNGWEGGREGKDGESLCWSKHLDTLRDSQVLRVQNVRPTLILTVVCMTCPATPVGRLGVKSGLKVRLVYVCIYNS